VYVGAHFPFDVGAGLLLGALIAAAFAGLAWFAARLMARPGSTIAPASPD
jgi:membrane-associated phospholipid phosphatase